MEALYQLSYSPEIAPSTYRARNVDGRTLLQRLTKSQFCHSTEGRSRYKRSIS